MTENREGKTSAQKGVQPTRGTRRLFRLGSSERSFRFVSWFSRPTINASR